MTKNPPSNPDDRSVGDGGDKGSDRRAAPPDRCGDFSNRGDHILKGVANLADSAANSVAGGDHVSAGRANDGSAGASESEMASAVGALSQDLSDAEGAANATRSDDVVAATSSCVEHGWVARLMEKEGPAILRMLWRLLGSESDVMDAYQDCFCKLATRSGKRNLRSARAYAFRTAANIAIEMIRARRRRRAHWPAIVQRHQTAHPERPDRASGEPERTDRSAEHDRSGRLRAALAQLPPHLRNVVVLRDLSRLSYGEVGRTLGIEATTARVYRRHAVVKLAELLGEEDTS